MRSIEEWAKNLSCVTRRMFHCGFDGLNTIPISSRITARIHAVVWALRQVVTHWRTSLIVVAVLAWWQWWGLVSLAVTAGVVAGVLTAWRLVDLESFDAWAGRHLRAWWLRWTLYAPKLPRWLHACGLTVTDSAIPVDVTVNPIGRKEPRGQTARRQAAVAFPRLLWVRSGPSWDEVRVRLVPGQKPEDFDEAAGRWPRPGWWPAARSANSRPMWSRSISSAATCSLTRWPAPTSPALADVAGTTVDLRRVWSGRTEYGQDWHVPLGRGSHPGGRFDRGGQELGACGPAGVHRPRHPRRPRPGLGNRPQGHRAGLRTAHPGTRRVRS